MNVVYLYSPGVFLVVECKDLWSCVKVRRSNVVYPYSPGVFLVVEWTVVEAACMSLVRGRLFLLPRSILSGRLRAVGICG
jgi:hypothetical protein